MLAVALVFVVLLGLAVGSFLNVVIYRVPAGVSVVSPGSACPACDQPIRNRDNVPVLGWLLLRGRCRDCGEPISARYPLVEALTAVVFVVLALNRGVHADLPAFLYLGAVGVALAAIDIDHKRLPDVLTLPSYPVGIVLLGAAAVVDHNLHALVRSLIGMVALYLFFGLLWFVYPVGMGFGDVKLSGVLGLYLGWIGYGALVVGGFAAFLIGGLAGIGLMVVARAGRKTQVPFGPYMLVGALVGILAGEALAHAYVSVAFGG